MVYILKLVTIVMPTYKRDLIYVKRTVESILCQTYKNLEIIIVDDSPDSYSKRGEIESYINSIDDPRIIFIKNEKNLGGSLARNVGINMATGYYTTFLDDDDRYLPEKISAQVEYMESTDLDMSFSNILIMTMNEKLIDVRNYDNVSSFENKEFIKYHLMRHATGTPTFMYKTEKLQEIGGFDDAIMGQEFYLMLKSIEKNLAIGYLNRYDVVVYKHKDDAISKGENKIIGENLLYERKKKYYHLFTNSEIAFIKMRHYVVLAIAHRRNGNYLGFFLNLVKAFICSPLQMLKEGFKFIKKVIEQRRIYSSNSNSND